MQRTDRHERYRDDERPAPEPVGPSIRVPVTLPEAGECEAVVEVATGRVLECLVIRPATSALAPLERITSGLGAMDLDRIADAVGACPEGI